MNATLTTWTRCPLWCRKTHLEPNCGCGRDGQGEGASGGITTSPTHHSQQTLWAYEFMYGAVVSITKLSIIMFYRRIFAVRTFTYVLWFLLSITIGWWIAVYIVAIVQCRPYYFFWKQYTDPTAHGHCINVSSFFVGNAAASVVTDCLILASPIPMVWRLRMPVTQKLAVCGIFLLGGL